MLRGYKYRIYPDKEQMVILNKTFGCVRYVFNHYLEKRIRCWEKELRRFSYNDCSSDMTALKQEHTWLKEVDSIALQQSLRVKQESPNFKSLAVKWGRFKSNRYDPKTAIPP